MSLGSELADGWQCLTAAGARQGASWQTLKSALLASATSVIAYPVSAQQAEPVPLPPLNVEAAAKKKAPAKKAAAKKAPSTQAVAPAPQPPPTQQQANPLPGQAGPAAPGVYNAQYSTSSKVTGPLLNTPQTVSVIPGTIIQERKATTLVETLRNTPGITFDAGENAFGAGGNQFNIRGFNSVGSVFIDGTRDNGSFTRDVFNLEQVEIFKGPAADNGRGAAGGYVNQVSKTPKLKDFTEIEVGIGFDEYDSEARRRAAFDVNQSSGVVAARLNAFVQDGGVAGRDVVEANAWGAAPSLAFGLGTDTRAIFAYEHIERNDLPDSGVAINRSVAQRGVGIEGAGPRAYVPGNPRDTFFGRTTDYDDVESDAVLARFEYDIAPGVTISNQTRWAEVARSAATSTHPTTLTNPMGLFVYDRTNESLYNQTNLAARFYTGQFRHTLSTGVELSREEANSKRASNKSADVGIDTVAVYAYDTVKLNRQWEAVGGIRVEHYEVDLVGEDLPGNRYSDSETTVGGKLGVVYKPVQNGSLYAAYSLSHLPHGSLLSNPDITRGDANAFPGFVAGADPVEFHNYEIGAKWDFFDGKLSTTAAAFHTVKKNASYPVPGSGTPPRVVYGEQVVDGIELGVAGSLTDRWKMFGGLTFLDSERRHGKEVDDALRSGGSNNDYGGSPANLTATTNGDELAFTPKFFATLWTTYDVTKEFTVGGGIQYVGESWIGRPDDALRVIKNGVYGKVPDYFLVNLYASYDITDNVELSLNVDNVFDELYLTTANWGANWGYLGAPRTYWLNASVKY